MEGQVTDPCRLGSELPCWLGRHRGSKLAPSNLMSRDVALDHATPSAERSRRGLSVAACDADISSASMHAPLLPRNSAPLLPSRATADHGAGGEAWRPLVRGSCASLVNVVATFPMNKMMFRQQGALSLRLPLVSYSKSILRLKKNWPIFVCTCHSYHAQLRATRCNRRRTS